MTTTYVDKPVDPALFGWGRTDLNLAQNLAREAGLLDELPNVVMARDAAVTAMVPEIEALLRKRMKEQFDSGWNMLIAEEIGYRLDSSTTLMIPQNIGNCVGNSHTCLLACRIIHEVLAEGDAEDPLGNTMTGATSMIPFIPYSYGVGRWVGGMLGPGDGSYCGAQIDGTMKYGFLPCSTPGLTNYAGTLPQCSSDVGRLFGRSSAEIQKWVPQAIKFDLLEAPRVKSLDDSIDLLVNKQIPQQICSGWGFAYAGFDSKYGVHLYKRSGSWSHSMQIVAIFYIKGQGFAVIRNQWGLDAARGSPEIGIPPGCMVIPLELLGSWIKSAEVIGIGQIKGLPQNPGF